MKALIKDGVVYSPYPRIDIPVCSFYALAKEKLLLNPKKMALISDRLCLTREEVLASMQSYAIGFRQNGVLPGDHVCIHMNNSVENLIAIYGCILAGATVFLASTTLSESELRYEAEDGNCTHVITDEPNAMKVRNAFQGLNIKGFCVGQAPGFVSTSEFLKIDNADFCECHVYDPKNTVLAVCYTSGSTGLPKGAEVTHHSYVACFYTTREHVPWGDGDILLGLNPITHQAGMLYAMIAVLDGATCAVVAANMTPAEIMDAVDKYKATAAQIFPGQLQALVREIRHTGRTLPSMRGIGAGGSILSTYLAEEACQAFSGLELLIHVYGMTESCCIVTCQSKDEGMTTGADVGFPATNVEVKIVDIVTREKLGPRRTGEVCFRTTSMMRGYYKRPKDTAELIDEDGWCYSGDAGYYDDDGRLYIVERLKQLIKCLDNVVVPAELEQLLLREYASDIAEVSVVGLPHPDYVEAPTAAVVLTDKGRKKDLEMLAEKIKATVAGRHALHRRLYGGVVFVDSLPKTATEKVSRPALSRTLASLVNF